MIVLFYIAGLIAVIATARSITHLSAVRALLYLIVSFLALSVIFFSLGAPFAAALEVITYAGAIMVLFVFVMMMLNLGPLATKQEKSWLHPMMFVGPGILALFLLAAWIYAIAQGAPMPVGRGPIGVVNAEQVGGTLLGPYLIGVEAASILLLAGLVGAYRMGYRRTRIEAEETGEAGRIVAREVT